MIQVFKNRITMFALLVALLLPGLLVQGASAATNDAAKKAVCEGIGQISGQDGCESDPGDAEVDSTLQTVINILTFVGAVIAVIMIIIGGIRYVTSSGDSTSTANARNTIIYAIVGLVIIALSQLLVRFVASRIDSPDGAQPACSIEEIRNGLC